MLQQTDKELSQPLLPRSSDDTSSGWRSPPPPSFSISSSKDQALLTSSSHESEILNDDIHHKFTSSQSVKRPGSNTDDTKSNPSFARTTALGQAVLLLIVSLVSIGLGACVTLQAVDTKLKVGNQLGNQLGNSCVSGKCPAPEALSVKAPHTNIWKNLDVAEAVNLRQWLMDPARKLNLTHADMASDKDNFIHLVEIYPPSKASALAYLSTTPSPPYTTAAPPEKYARAIINQGSTETIVDYLVGPLPISNSTTIRPLKEIYHTPSIPLNARTTYNYTVAENMTMQLLAPLDNVTADLFNISTSMGNINVGAQMPMSYDGSWRRTWLQLKHNLPGSWLHSLDLYLLVDLTDNETDQWRIMAIVHDGKMYDSVEEFVSSWQKGELKKVVDYDLSNWASRQRRGSERDLDNRAGPRSYLPGGVRYRIDLEQEYITWMNWSFYLSFERDMGLHLWSINFRGDRIIYQLSPQEAMAQYSGSDPFQASTVWLDRAFGMGDAVRPLIRGYDCPDYATYLNATVHDMGSTIRPDAICVFERESGRPISRHTGFVDGEMGAVKGYDLVVRTISSVGNYDYIWDYTFQLDGTIEIRVSASGYLQGGVWDDAQGPYGHKIRPSLMGSLHDHVMNFKIDFDIAGTKNSFTKISLEHETLEKPWFKADGWGPVTQSKIRRDLISTESKFDWTQNMEGTFVITNEAQKNSWGNPRGYMIHPGPLVKLANINAKRTEKSVNWAKCHLAVTKRQEDEPSSSSMWNGNLPGSPPVDFDKFFNNESIEQEDLVVWLNLGTHHIPRAEDSPNTLTNVATTYVLLSPWNFNDYDVSIESANSVLINKTPSGWSVEELITQPICNPPPPEPLTYEGMSAFKEDGTPFTPEEVNRFRSQAESVHNLGMWSLHP